MVNAEQLEYEFGITPDTSKALEKFFNDILDNAKILRKMISDEMTTVEEQWEFITAPKAIEEMRILAGFDAAICAIQGIANGE